MRILVIDNNIDLDSWGAAPLRRHASALAGATVVVRRAPQDDLPSDMSRYDRVIISGSKTAAFDEAPWISKLDELVRRLVDGGKPVLGVCYGHQTIARALGGLALVRRSSTPEVGWTEIETLAANPLFKGLPRKFTSFSVHYDEVSELPRGARLLARSDRCAIQAYSIDERPVFGIQFHPEKNLVESKASVEARIRRREFDVLIRPDEGDKLHDEKVGETIFGNFLRL